MSETQELLAKISALRQRLDQAQGLVTEARTAAAALESDTPSTLLVTTASDHDIAVDAAMRALAPDEERTPRQLSTRARRVLERGRELLGELRPLADTFAPQGPTASPLAYLYRDTVAMIDTALRTIALLPDAIAPQMQLCKGLEVTLEEVADRLRVLTAGHARQQHEERQIDRLTQLLIAVESRQPLDQATLHGLADEILSEARSCEPLRFLKDDPAFPPRFVACHSLTVARVLARVLRHESDLRNRARDVIVAGLLHDVGMLRVPTDALTHPDPVDPEQRREIEAHAVVGAQLLAHLLPEASWLSDATGGHHERIDGTGYPDGVKGSQLRPLTRLLAVCDVYAALCCDRPHRPGRPTRTALADTLLLAEQGLLDRNCAECLLALSFYPVGSVVELAQGAVGVVVATPPRADLQSPARPVVALLTDEQGRSLPRPHHLDLAEADLHSIVRPLTADERRELLGRRFPQWAA